MVFCFCATIAQYTSIYQYIEMTGYPNGYITVNVAYDVLTIRPISQYDFIPTI